MDQQCQGNFGYFPQNITKNKNIVYREALRFTSSRPYNIKIQFFPAIFLQMKHKCYGNNEAFTER